MTDFSEIVIGIANSRGATMILMAMSLFVAACWIARWRIRPLYKTQSGEIISGFVAYAFLFVFYHAVLYENISLVEPGDIRLLVALSRLSIFTILFHGSMSHLYIFWLNRQMRGADHGPGD